MKIVFLGYHEIGYVALEFFKQAGADIRAVFTHQDDAGENIWFRSVAKLAEHYRIPVYVPDRINDTEWVEVVRACNPEMLFSFYYRKIVSPAILAIPPRGCYNLHGSLLPRFRGRSPTNWAILMGEKKTGVTLHEMVARADAGRIVAQREVKISTDDTVKEVLLKQVAATQALLAEVYPLLAEGRAPMIPQDEHLATKFGGRRPEDGVIDWGRSAESIHNLVRAVAYPWPGAFTTLRGQTCIVWQTRRFPNTENPSPLPPGALIAATQSGVLVACGVGCLEIMRAQIPPEPCVAGEELKKLLGPIPGPGFKSMDERML